MKKILLKGIVLAVLLSSICGLCVYSETASSSHSFTYEQITKMYPSMEQYYASARRDIKNNWYPPVGSFENSATIVLTINKNGKLQNCYLIKPSKDDGFNNSLIIAAQKAKYAPLPDEVKQESLDLIMQFNMQRRHINIDKSKIQN